MSVVMSVAMALVAWLRALLFGQSLLGYVLIGVAWGLCFAGAWLAAVRVWFGYEVERDDVARALAWGAVVGLAWLFTLPVGVAAAALLAALGALYALVLPATDLVERIEDWREAGRRAQVAVAVDGPEAMPLMPESSAYLRGGLAHPAAAAPTDLARSPRP